MVVIRAKDDAQTILHTFSQATAFCSSYSLSTNTKYMVEYISLP